MAMTAISTGLREMRLAGEDCKRSAKGIERGDLPKSELSEHGYIKPGEQSRATRLYRSPLVKVARAPACDTLYAAVSGYKSNSDYRSQPWARSSLDGTVSRQSRNVPI